MPEEKNEVIEEVTENNVTVEVEDVIDNPNTVEENLVAQHDGIDETPEPVKKISKFERKRKINKIVKTTFAIVCWTICAFVLVLCVSNLYQQIFNPDGYTGLFGLGEAVVASDSMDAVGSTPRIQKNDLVFYKEADVTVIQPNDIVIYETNTSSGTKLIIHRVVEIKEDGTFIAKGDNNAVADDPMPLNAIVGQYLFKINDVGVIFNLLSAKFAPLLIILFIVLVFAIRVALYFFNKKRTIQKISTNETNRDAINHFFDI